MSRVFIGALAIIGAIAVGFASWTAADWIRPSVHAVDGTVAPAPETETGPTGDDLPRAGSPDESEDITGDE